jgi:hypothetical protein
MANNIKDSLMRVMLMSAIAFTLAGGQIGLSQASVSPSATPRQPVVQYTAPKIGTPLGDGRHTVRSTSPIYDTCLFYARPADSGTGVQMFWLSGPAFEHLQGTAPWINVVLEKNPGGNTCPAKHRISGYPLIKLERPMEYNSATQQYNFTLLPRNDRPMDCQGTLGNFLCTKR